MMKTFTLAVFLVVSGVLFTGCKDSCESAIQVKELLRNARHVNSLLASAQLTAGQYCKWTSEHRLLLEKAAVGIIDYSRDFSGTDDAILVKHFGVSVEALAADMKRQCSEYEITKRSYATMRENAHAIVFDFFTLPHGTLARDASQMLRLSCGPKRRGD